MKAAELYEMNGKYSDALKLYERSRKNILKALKDHQLTKYIARVKLLSK